MRCFTINPSQVILEKLESATRELAAKHLEPSREDSILSNALDVDYYLHLKLINEMKNNIMGQEHKGEGYFIIIKQHRNEGIGCVILP